MKTVTIVIDNSDDRLCQSSWVLYIDDVRQVLLKYTNMTHTDGLITECFTQACSCLQHAVFVASVHEDNIYPMKEDIAAARALHGQDSSAVTIGDTEFI